MMLSCGGVDTPAPTPAPTPNPTRVSLSQTRKFTMNGVNGQKSQQCGEYRVWRSTLDTSGGYSAIRATSQGRTSFVCSDKSIATRICRSIAAGETFSGVQCGDHYWSSGSCGQDSQRSDLFGTTGYEIKVTETNSHSICSCPSDSLTAIFRPCLGNSNWGGFRDRTCGSDTIDMTIECSGVGGGNNNTPTPTTIQSEKKVSFEMNGVQGTKISEECGQWRSFRHSLDATARYSQVEVMSKSGGGSPFRCNDAKAASQICQAMAKSVNFSGVQCGGAYWSSGSCGSDTTNSDLFGSNT